MNIYLVKWLFGSFFLTLNYRSFSSKCALIALSGESGEGPLIERMSFRVTWQGDWFMATLAVLIWINLRRYFLPLYVNESQLCPWRMIFQAWTLLLSLYTVTPPPDVPHCGRLWGTCERLIANHTHMHTNTLRAPLGGGTSADLLRNKTVWAAEHLDVVSIKKRVKYCWQKGQHVCLGSKENISERRVFSESTDNVPSAHSGVCERHWTTAVRNYCIVIKWLLPHWQPY